MKPALPLSNLPGIVFPTMPNPVGTVQLALLYQIGQSEKWSPEQLAEAQYRQLSELLAHAWKTSPFYRARLDDAGYRPASPVTPEWFATLPLLNRQDLQENFDTIKSAAPPPQHGRLADGKSSGSTGRPIQYLTTEHTRTVWRTFILREHLWNQRDFGARLAMIRSKATDGSMPNWGPGVAEVFPSAPCQILNTLHSLERQAQWLREQAPDYLLVFPSNLRGLAEEFERTGTAPPQMQQIITMAEMLPPEVRSQCEAFFNAPIRDIYSASEAGNIAIQCDAGHYHLQEHLLVEILDDTGRPVAPGEWGKVVITSLHNFASPLIRYALGDYAEAGDFGCPCGRKLRRLNRVMGRSRNLLTLPDGRRFWPPMAVKDWQHAAGISRYQVVQKSPDTLEVRVEVPRPLTEDERARISTALTDSWGYPFKISFVEMREMPVPENGKFEDFKSEVTA
jgi:phenylacetate-CoA ligase